MDLVVFIYDGPVCVLIIRSREFAASKMPEFACRDRTRAPSMAILRRNLLMLNSVAFGQKASLCEWLGQVF